MILAKWEIWCLKMAVIALLWEISIIVIYPYLPKKK